jgi:hypothetical protein
MGWRGVKTRDQGIGNRKLNKAAIGEVTPYKQRPNDEDLSLGTPKHPTARIRTGEKRGMPRGVGGINFLANGFVDAAMRTAISIVLL